MVQQIVNSRPSDQPPGGEEEQYHFLHMPRSNLSGGGLLRSSNTSSSDNSFRYPLSGSGFYGDDYYNYAGSIPVESVYGSEHLSEYRNSQESPGSPNYSGKPSFIGQEQMMRGLMVEPDTPVIQEHQLIKWESKVSRDSTEGLTHPDDADDDDDDDDDFENSVGYCEENYREFSKAVGDQIVVRNRLEPPGDSPEEDTEEEEETTIVQSTQSAVVVRAELEENIRNQLALLDEPYDGFRHHFVTVRDEHRFLMLYTFLKRHVDQKIIIFFSTTKSTKYYAELLLRLKFDVRVAHYGQTKDEFLSEFLKFSKQSSSGILCIPDLRNEFGIPPSCEWIIQFEPPDNPTEYCRVERVCGESSFVEGRALLFVTPEQFGVLQYFKAAHVKLREYEMAKISKVQKDYVNLIRTDAKLRKLASEAYHAYLLQYASHKFRDVYNIHDLNEDKVAFAFGFTKPPRQQVEDEDEQKGEMRKDLDLRWKPVKIEKGDSWMRREKTWRYADRHSSTKKQRQKVQPVG